MPKYPRAKLPDYGETPGLCSDCIDKDIIIEDLQDALTAIRAINKAYVSAMRKDRKIIKWFVTMIIRLHNTHPHNAHGMLIWWGEIFRVLPKRIFRKT